MPGRATRSGKGKSKAPSSKRASKEAEDAPAESPRAPSPSQEMDVDDEEGKDPAPLPPAPSTGDTAAAKRAVKKAGIFYAMGGSDSTQPEPAISSDGEQEVTSLTVKAGSERAASPDEEMADATQDLATIAATGNEISVATEALGDLEDDPQSQAIAADGDENNAGQEDEDVRMDIAEDTEESNGSGEKVDDTVPDAGKVMDPTLEGSQNIAGDMDASEMVEAHAGDKRDEVFEDLEQMDTSPPRPSRAAPPAAKAATAVAARKDIVRADGQQPRPKPRPAPTGRAAMQLAASKDPSKEGQEGLGAAMQSAAPETTEGLPGIDEGQMPRRRGAASKVVPPATAAKEVEPAAKADPARTQDAHAGGVKKKTGGRTGRKGRKAVEETEDGDKEADEQHERDMDAAYAGSTMFNFVKPPANVDIRSYPGVPQRKVSKETAAQLLEHAKLRTFYRTNHRHAVTIIMKREDIDPSCLSFVKNVKPPPVKFPDTVLAIIVYLIAGWHRMFTVVRQFMINHNITDIDNVNWTPELEAAANEEGSFIADIYYEDVLEKSKSKHTILYNMRTNNETVSTEDSEEMVLVTSLAPMATPLKHVAHKQLREAVSAGRTKEHVKQLLGNWVNTRDMLVDMAQTTSFASETNVPEIFQPTVWVALSGTWGELIAGAHQLSKIQLTLAMELITNDEAVPDFAALPAADAHNTLEEYLTRLLPGGDVAARRFSEHEYIIYNLVLDAAEKALAKQPDLQPFLEATMTGGLLTGMTQVSEAQHSLLQDYWHTVADLIPGLFADYLEHNGARSLGNSMLFVRKADAFANALTMCVYAGYSPETSSPLNYGYRLPFMSPTLCKMMMKSYSQDDVKRAHTTLRMLINVFFPGASAWLDHSLPKATNLDTSKDSAIGLLREGLFQLMMRDEGREPLKPDAVWKNKIALAHLEAHKCALTIGDIIVAYRETILENELFTLDAYLEKFKAACHGLAADDKIYATYLINYISDWGGIASKNAPGGLLKNMRNFHLPQPTPAVEVAFEVTRAEQNLKPLEASNERQRFERLKASLAHFPVEFLNVREGTNEQNRSTHLRGVATHVIGADNCASEMMWIIRSSPAVSSIFDRVLAILRHEDVLSDEYIPWCFDYHDTEERRQFVANQVAQEAATDNLLVLDDDMLGDSVNDASTSSAGEVAPAGADATAIACRDAGDDSLPAAAVDAAVAGSAAGGPVDAGASAAPTAAPAAAATRAVAGAAPAAATTLSSRADDSTALIAVAASLAADADPPADLEILRVFQDRNISDRIQRLSKGLEKAAREFTSSGGKPMGAHWAIRNKTATNVLPKFVADNMMATYHHFIKELLSTSKLTRSQQQAIVKNANAGKPKFVIATDEEMKAIYARMIAATSKEEFDLRVKPTATKDAAAAKKPKGKGSKKVTSTEYVPESDSEVKDAPESEDEDYAEDADDDNVPDAKMSKSQSKRNLKAKRDALAKSKETARAEEVKRAKAANATPGAGSSRSLQAAPKPPRRKHDERSSPPPKDNAGDGEERQIKRSRSNTAGDKGKGIAGGSSNKGKGKASGN